MTSLSEGQATIFFSFSHRDAKTNWVDLDPRMGSFKIWQQSLNMDDQGQVNFNRTEFSVDKLTAENFPELFVEEDLIPIWLNG